MLCTWWCLGFAKAFRTLGLKFISGYGLIPPPGSSVGRPDPVLHPLGAESPLACRAPPARGTAHKIRDMFQAELPAAPPGSTGPVGKAREPQGFKRVLRPSLQCGGDPVACPGRSAQAALSMKKTSSRSTHSSSHREVSAYPCPHPHALYGCLSGVGCHTAPPYTVYLPPDSSTYATFLFNAFDTDHDGSVSFEVSCCRGGDGSGAGRAQPFRYHRLG